MALDVTTHFSINRRRVSAVGTKAALVVSQKRLEELDLELVAVIQDEVVVQTPPPFVNRVRVILE